MNPEFNGMKMNRVSICSRLPPQAVLGPLRRYVASGFRLNVQFFANGGVTPSSSPRFSAEWPLSLACVELDMKKQG
jgi:hypothetical protein